MSTCLDSIKIAWLFPDLRTYFPWPFPDVWQACNYQHLTAFVYVLAGCWQPVSSLALFPPSPSPPPPRQRCVQKLETGVFTLKANQMLPSPRPGRNLKTQQSPAILFFFGRKLSREIMWLSWCHRFFKAPFAWQISVTVSLTVTVFWSSSGEVLTRPEGLLDECLSVSFQSFSG